ncbi:MAG: GldG family protein, partial [Candidatus Omnitrophica bacterium]|nr:GldG family protein [Candidatus Omnitrophota bacterium]
MKLRRWIARLNLAATLALVGALFILVNFLASRRYSRLDVTRNHLATLSEKTVQVLTHLTEPVSIVVFYQRSASLHGMVTDLLKEYERHTSRLTIEYVDPLQDRARAEQLAKQFEIDRLNLLIVQAGSRHKYLSDTDLAEYDYAAVGFGEAPTVKTFKGEDALTSAILSVTQAHQSLVWITRGHGEKTTEQDVGGIDELQKAFERENMQVESVALLEKPEIPQEVNVVVMPGPTRRVMEQELAALQSYLDRGGRLLALIDPLQETGLDDFLSRWGVELGHDMVVDPARQLPFVSAANVFVTTYTRHPVVEHMETLMTLFPLARSVQPAKETGGLTVTQLALTSEQGWGETTTQDTTFTFAEGTDRKGPVSLAVAVERTTPPPVRLVVIGDSDFVTN